MTPRSRTSSEEVPVMQFLPPRYGYAYFGLYFRTSIIVMQFSMLVTIIMQLIKHVHKQFIVHVHNQYALCYACAYSYLVRRTYWLVSFEIEVVLEMQMPSPYPGLEFNTTAESICGWEAPMAHAARQGRSISNKITPTPAASSVRSWLARSPRIKAQRLS